MVFMYASITSGLYTEVEQDLLHTLSKISKIRAEEPTTPDGKQQRVLQEKVKVQAISFTKKMIDKLHRTQRMYELLENLLSFAVMALALGCIALACVQYKYERCKKTSQATISTILMLACVVATAVTMAISHLVKYKIIISKAAMDQDISYICWFIFLKYIPCAEAMSNASLISGLMHNIASCVRTIDPIPIVQRVVIYAMLFGMFLGIWITPSLLLSKMNIKIFSALNVESTDQQQKSYNKVLDKVLIWIAIGVLLLVVQLILQATLSRTVQRHQQSVPLQKQKLNALIQIKNAYNDILENPAAANEYNTTMHDSPLLVQQSKVIILLSKLASSIANPILLFCILPITILYILVIKTDDNVALQMVYTAVLPEEVGNNLIGELKSFIACIVLIIMGLIMYITGQVVPRQCLEQTEIQISNEDKLTTLYSSIAELLEYAEVPSTSYPPTTDKNGLYFENLSISHGPKKIFSDFTHNIQPGEKYLLLGKSGSGKSTLILAALSLLTPTAGNVFMHQQNVHIIDNKQRPVTVAYMSQMIQDTPKTIEEEIEYRYGVVEYSILNRALEIAAPLMHREMFHHRLVVLIYHLIRYDIQTKYIIFDEALAGFTKQDCVVFKQIMQPFFTSDRIVIAIEHNKYAIPTYNPHGIMVFCKPDDTKPYNLYAFSTQQALANPHVKTEIAYAPLDTSSNTKTSITKPINDSTIPNSKHIHQSLPIKEPAQAPKQNANTK
jgi:ABC-type multidrug transport system fused ATPase/permease subunit